MQIIELQSHPYFVGVQFHPEFKSRPGKPSALFLGELSILVICYIEAHKYLIDEINKLTLFVMQGL